MAIRNPRELARARSPRVGRDERERCVDALQEHYAAGRLREDELGERIGSALTATTEADLQDLLDDLPAQRPPAGDPVAYRPLLLTLATAALVALLGVAAVSASSSTTAASTGTPVCASTGEATGPDAGCPMMTPVQQKIFADADQADRAAQQLVELADRNPGVRLGPLLERAWTSSGRARDAAGSSQQVILTAQGEPSDTLLAEIARRGERAAQDTQRALDLALDRVDG